MRSFSTTLTGHEAAVRFASFLAFFLIFGAVELFCSLCFLLFHFF